MMPTPEPQPPATDSLDRPALPGAQDVDQEIEDLLSLLRAEPSHLPHPPPAEPDTTGAFEDAQHPAATSPQVDERDRATLGQLYEQLLGQYLEPISQYIRLLMRREYSVDALEGFKELLGPVITLSIALEMTGALGALQQLRGQLDHPGLRRSRPPHRLLAPLETSFDHLLGQLSPGTREHYRAAVFYRHKSNPLLEELRRIKQVGPRRLQRLYAVGLVTPESIAEASAPEISDVTGLPLRLCETIRATTAEFVAAQQRMRSLHTVELAQELALELKETHTPDELSPTLRGALIELKLHLDHLLNNHTPTESP